MIEDFVVGVSVLPFDVKESKLGLLKMLKFFLVFSKHCQCFTNVEQSGDDSDMEHYEFCSEREPVVAEYKPTLPSKSQRVDFMQGLCLFSMFQIVRDGCCGTGNN